MIEKAKGVTISSPRLSAFNLKGFHGEAVTVNARHLRNLTFEHCSGCITLDFGCDGSPANIDYFKINRCSGSLWQTLVTSFSQALRKNWCPEQVSILLCGRDESDMIVNFMQEYMSWSKLKALELEGFGDRVFEMEQLLDEASLLTQVALDSYIFEKALVKTLLSSCSHDGDKYTAYRDFILNAQMMNVRPFGRSAID
jgi:hypothetical protein